MKRNFHIEGIIHFVCDGKSFDVHNGFLFGSFFSDTENGRVALEWTSDPAGIRLRLIFNGVALVKVRKSSDGAKSEASVTSFLGFTHPYDVDLMDGFSPDENADGHFIVGFEDGSAIKVDASEAVFEVLKDH